MKQILFFLLFSISIYSSEVLIYGDPMTDYITFVDEAFLDSLPGEKSGSAPVNLFTFNRLIQNYTTKCTGGSAVNTLKGLASLGHSCTVIGRIGEDEEGLNLMQSLLSRGISHHYTACSPSTGKVVCMISPDGHRTMRSHTIDIIPFTTTPSMFEGVKLFHIEGYQIFNPPFLKSLISQAKQAGALVSMDVGCFE
ncbi:MAG: 2-dehydro-3-deoxygluconokinase, partial [Chlamydiae bacterium]|nr:2-dehydro-3-deoxygluconokinase [Chlamydiota bacterium]